jgi:hypothetical protein
MILHEITPNPKLQWPPKYVKVEKFLFWKPVTYFLSTCSVLPPCASSTMNELGHHSGLAPTAFLFNSVIHGERSIYLLLFLMMKAIGTPLRHLSNTITVYKGNCTHGNGTSRDNVKSPIPVADVVFSSHRPR